MGVCSRCAWKTPRLPLSTTGACLCTRRCCCVCTTPHDRRARAAAFGVDFRALLYFRLLRRNVDDACAVVGGVAEAKGITSFLEELNNEVKERIYAEFNTLSCVYGESSESFVDDDYKFKPAVQDAFGLGGDESKTNGWGESGGAGAGDGGVDLLGGAPAAAAPAAAGGADMGLDLLGFMDGPAAAPAAPAWSLAPSPALAPADYQSKWMALQANGPVNVSVRRVPSEDEMKSAMAAANIACMASGDAGPVLKFFFFGHVRGRVAGVISNTGPVSLTLCGIFAGHLGKFPPDGNGDRQGELVRV